MLIRALTFTAVILLYVASANSAVTVQDPGNVLGDGSAFLWVEAESAELRRQSAVGEDLGIDDPTTGIIKVSKANPITTITEDANGIEVVNGGLDVLLEDANASNGEAIFLNLGSGGANTAAWQVQFAIPATYYLYLHYSFYNRDTNSNYGNEDSVYAPPSFNANSRADWIGFEGVDRFGDPKTGNSDRDGWMPLGKDIVSEGEVETHNSTDEEFWDGQFHWAVRRIAVDMDENNAFVGDDGHGIQYDVAEADVGTVLDFELSAREPYGVIDGLLFSTSELLLEDFSQEQMDEFFLNLGGVVPVTGDFDNSGVLDLPDVNMLNAQIASGTNDPAFNLDADPAVNGADLNVWVKDLRSTWFGDANLDGEFGSGDLVDVFQAGKYEVNEDATWAQGDWTGDLRFDSGDLVAAFQDGGFEKGPIGANTVPEPSAIVLCSWLGLALTLKLRRRR